MSTNECEAVYFRLKALFERRTQGQPLVLTECARREVNALLASFRERALVSALELQDQYIQVVMDTVFDVAKRFQAEPEWAEYLINLACFPDNLPTNRVAFEGALDRLKMIRGGWYRDVSAKPI